MGNFYVWPQTEGFDRTNDLGFGERPEWLGSVWSISTRAKAGGLLAKVMVVTVCVTSSSLSKPGLLVDSDRVFQTKFQFCRRDRFNDRGRCKRRTKRSENSPATIASISFNGAGTWASM